MDCAVGLENAKGYLAKISLRPLWKGYNEQHDHFCYPPCYKNEGTLNVRLSAAYKIWCTENSPDTVHGKGIPNNYPERFLDFFAQTHLNIPEPPLGYGLVTDFNVNWIIKNRIKTPAESLKEKLGPIGVKALDEKGPVKTVFPIAFLKLLQDVIKSDSSLRGDNLIKTTLSRYQEDLLSRQEELESFANTNATTQACMDVSLAKEIENFRAFLANRDNLLASAGQ
jgi:hypothetical protein